MRVNPKKVLLAIITIGLGSWGAISLITALAGEGAGEPSVNGLTEITRTVHVNANWSAVQAAYPWCSGAGTAANPYIIENLYMNCHGTRTGILIEHASEHFVLRNCTVINAEPNGSGIWLQFVDNGEISGNTVVNNQGGGIYLYYDCNNITVIGNTVSDNEKNGVYVSAGQDNRVSGNTVHRNVGRGIWLMKADDNDVIGNNLKDNYAGIGITNSNGSRVMANTLSLNNEGISLLNSRDNVISQNTVQFNVQGILFSSSSGNTVSGCDFVLNMVMKTEDESSSGNIFAGNHEESVLVGFTGAAVFITAFAIIGLVTIKYWRKKP